MINQIIEGIGAAIYDAFGEEYKIYANEVKQGLEEPCFLISCVSPKRRLFFDKRYFRENLFCVQYFPQDENREADEAREAVEKLYTALEWITVDGDLTMGTNMHAEFSDGVMNFFVNYDMFTRLRDDDEVELMGELHFNYKPTR